MAEASRALARVSRLHGFRVDGDPPAVRRRGGRTQSGHALPPATRRATLEAEAILVAAANEPALAGVESELDLHAAHRSRRRIPPRGAITVLSPLDETAAEWTLSGAPSTSPARAAAA